MSDCSRAPYIRLRYFCSPHHSASAFIRFRTARTRRRVERHDACAIKLDKLRPLLAGHPPRPKTSRSSLICSRFPATGPFPDAGFQPQQRKRRTLEALIAQLMRSPAKGRS